MPIVNMTSEYKFPENAKNIRGHDHVVNHEVSSDVIGPCPYWTYETHNGLCLFEEEHNTYHDSDFYMIVWDVEKKEPQRLLFASTRGWTYPCYASHLDATEEIKKEYQDWLNRKKIEEAEKRVLDFANFIDRHAAKTNLTTAEFSRLLIAYRIGKHNFDQIGDFEFGKVLRLIKSKPRNEFRKSLKKQIIDWAKDPTPTYKTPLSPKQVGYL